MKGATGYETDTCGAGLLGLFAVQYARLSGAYPVIVSDFDASRRDLALKLGADVALSPDAPAVYTRLAEDRHFPIGVLFDWNRL